MKHENENSSIPLVPRYSTQWWSRWYPEVKFGVVVSFLLTLAFPPFAIDPSPGATTFQGWHSLFTHEVGYLSLSRLVLSWLLILAVAALAQLSGEYRSQGVRQRDETGDQFFGVRLASGASPLSESTLGLILVALPIWLVLCGLVVGRTKIMMLESELAYYGCVAFQLVVLSRIIIWLSRDRSHLQLYYAILCVASFAWDLRTSPTPADRVAGLVPIYLALGFLLYRFDLRFTDDAAPRRPLPVPGLSAGASDPVTDDASNPEASVAAESPSHEPPRVEIRAEAEKEIQQTAQSVVQESEVTEIAPDAQGRDELELLGREPGAADPYSRYRPKQS